MIEYDPSEFFHAHPYVVELPDWHMPSLRKKEILAWCTNRWGTQSDMPYPEEGMGHSEWVMMITVIRFRTYESAFEFQMRWGGS